MTERSRLKTVFCAGFILISTLLIFQFSFGFERVNPSFVDWLFYLDPGTHYLGWAYFRMDPWFFPLGKTISYGYPVGTNVGLTDSIPLLAIPGKLLNGVLPNPFQYFGLVALFNYFLQAFATFFAARKMSASKIQSALLAILLLLSPPFLLKTPIHSALSSHWLLIFGFAWMGSIEKNATRVWLGLILLSALIHPYLWAMVFMMSALHEWLLAKRLFELRIWKNLALFFIFSLITWFGVGTLGGSDAISPGIGGFSAHLSSLFDPSGFSGVFPGISFEQRNSQESFGYLGLGLLLLFFLGTAVFLRSLVTEKINLSRRKKIVFLFFIVFVMGSFVFAWGNHVLLDLFKPMRLFGAVHLLSIFRSTGRFVWVLFYAVSLWSFSLILKKNPKLLTPLLIIALPLQWIDISPVLKSIRFKPETITNTHWMNSEHWKSLCQNKKHLYFYPNEYDIPELRYAHECGATVNTAYSARAPKGRDEVLNKIFEAMILGKMDGESLFILKGASADAARTRLKSPDLTAEEYDGTLIVSSKFNR